MTVRRFAIVKPEVLWTGWPGQELRAVSGDAFKLATYLLTGPNVEIWGLWQLESKVVGFHTGIGPKKLVSAFDVLREMKWAFYENAWVFVPDMPAAQFPRWPLQSHDNSIRAAKMWYAQLPDNPFLGTWFDRHQVDLSLPLDPDPVERRGASIRNPSPSETVEPPAPVFDLLGEALVTKPLTVSAIDAWFERIAAIYPKKDKLHRARMTLAHMRPTEQQMQEIWQTLIWQVQQTDWLKASGRYAPSLSAYFKDKRWLDKKNALPRLNESTLDALDTARGFIHDEEPCRETRKSGGVLPRPFSRLRS